MNYPAPWKLRGEGFILTYSFNKDWMLDYGFIPAHLQRNFKGGLSFVMLVDYQEADCGAYRELLFIPGLFQINGKYHLMITKIYVDSEDSKTSGRENWGIPKELANINWKKDGNRTLFRAENDHGKFFECQIQSNAINFPVNNTLVPFKFFQEMAGNQFFFDPKGKGKATIGSVKGISSDSNLFPDLAKGKFINCMHVKTFDLTFPKSEVKRMEPDTAV